MHEGAKFNHTVKNHKMAAVAQDCTRIQPCLIHRIVCAIFWYERAVKEHSKHNLLYDFFFFLNLIVKVWHQNLNWNDSQASENMTWVAIYHGNVISATSCIMIMSVSRHSFCAAPISVSTPWLLLLHHLRYFGHFWPFVWLSSISNFNLRASLLASAKKPHQNQRLWVGGAVAVLLLVVRSKKTPSCSRRNFRTRKNSCVRELSHAINFRTARTVSHTLLHVHGFRMLLNFVLSAESTKLIAYENLCDYSIPESHAKHFGKQFEQPKTCHKLHAQSKPHIVWVVDRTSMLHTFYREVTTLPRPAFCNLQQRIWRASWQLTVCHGPWAICFWKVNGICWWKWILQNLVFGHLLGIGWNNAWTQSAGTWPANRLWPATNMTWAKRGKDVEWDGAQISGEI